MLVVEDKPLLSVDAMADIETWRANPLWWKPPEREELRKRLDDRVDRKKNKKRVPKTSRK